MPSYALQGFVRAFNNPNSTRIAASLPTFLVPAAARSILATPPHTKQHQGGHRRNASTSTPDKRSSNVTFRPDYNRQIVTPEQEPAVSSKDRKEPRAWAELVEAYLPLHLRQGGQNIVDTLTEFRDLHSIHTLPLLLSKARSYAKVDLLSYLGVLQGRWDAVIWLVKAMMEDYPDLLRSETESRQLPNLVWPPLGRSLDAITNQAVETGFTQYSKASLGSLIQNQDFNTQNGPMTLGRQYLGQIWQSLGTMILQAADRSAEDPNYSLIMSRVFQILSHLHHIEAFPDSIYNYSPAKDQTVVQRPPTLHLLSRRIMSTLSDLEWGLQWQAEISKYQKLGYELPKATVPPKIREFGPELWLDLVLWACVEGGWITEGAWIVTEMERRRGSASTQWSVISWQDVCAHKEPKLDWASIMKLQIERTTLNQVGGIGTATGPDSTVHMGERTVSREVILSIMDGLVNTPLPSQSSARGSCSSSVQQGLMDCKNLLERHYPQLDNKFLNANILRIMESFGLDITPGLLQRLLNIRALKVKGVPAKKNASSPFQDFDTDDSAAFLGLLHRNLNGFAHEDNVQGSFSTFRQIQDLVDQKRGSTIQDFADELQNRTRQGDDSPDFIVDAESNTSTIYPQVPVSALVALVDLITDSKYYDLGKWLLLNDDLDGGAFDPELYSEPNLQPALLRFATATTDNNLLTKVLERLQAPLSEPILHAVLRCQIALGKWEAVEDLLGHFQKAPGMGWVASDATAIARGIMQMEYSPSDSTSQDQMERARELLYNLLRGRYNTARDPSQPYDFSQTRTANQLGRIFRSLPGSLGNITEEALDNTERAQASIGITSNSFNILVETIVECNGPRAGKELWEQWCRDPGETKLFPYIRRSPVDTDENRELVVTPRIYMLRNILQTMVLDRQLLVRASEGKADSDMKDKTADATPNPRFPSSLDVRTVRAQRDDQDILDWGINMYGKFGFSEKEIRKEIPGAFPYVRKEKLGDVVGP